MSSEAKLVWRAAVLGISAFTSGYFARMMDDGKGNMATVGYIFALWVAVFVALMIIRDTLSEEGTDADREKERRG